MKQNINIVACENCGREFNNFYKKHRWTKIGCSRKCRRILRNKFNVQKRKERRHQLRKELRCIVCGEKVKPVYPQYCLKHKQKMEKIK